MSQVIESTRALNINPEKITIRSRISPPAGFSWVKEKPGSFEDYLINFPLKPEGFPVRDYKDLPISRQYNHVAILDIDVGRRDLQQCADAWMRLYSEYLWQQNRSEEVVFQFTSGQPMSWIDYKKGMRTTEVGDRVRFHLTAKPDASYRSFRKYLDLIFQYAGTISIDRESVPIKSNKDIKVGDYLIKPGSPGHLVFIVGIAQNRAGKRIYLLAESFMPAQDIHILINPLNRNLSPWYELDVNAPRIITAKYVFSPPVIKRFHAIK